MKIIVKALGDFYGGGGWKGENLGSVDWYTLTGDWAGNALARGAVEPEKTALWSQH